MFSKINLWSIYCSTGCTCCADENHTKGFFKSEEEAAELVAKWRNGEDNPVASQYAPYGRYRIQKHTAELLPDGRMIVDGYNVYPQGHYSNNMEYDD